MKGEVRGLKFERKLYDAVNRSSITIIGSGWLGLELARKLVCTGHKVTATTTHPDRTSRILETGALATVLKAGPGVDRADYGHVLEADWVIITIPPSGADDYAATLRSLGEAADVAGTTRLLMTSSTSVYRDLDRVVVEDDADEESGPPRNRNGDEVLAAEHALQSVDSSAAILRLAGLYGPGRHPVRYLAGRAGLSGALSPVNLVHSEDVVRAVIVAMGHTLSGPFNIVADSHPSRGDLYTSLASRMGLEPPSFDEAPSSWKVVSGEAFKRATGFKYLHHDPMLWTPQ